MGLKTLLKLAALLLLSLGAADAKQAEGIFSFDGAEAGNLLLAGPGVAPEIWVAPDDLPGVIRVAGDLATDFNRVLAGSGSPNATVVSADWSAASAARGNTRRPVIVVGTVGHSSLVDGLVSSKRLDASAVAGQWETFLYQVVPAPWASGGGNNNASSPSAAVFVIAGSDLRGSVFGAYGASEQIGVSPWYWWADAPPRRRTHISVVRGSNTSSTQQHVEGPPSVKFRGIFLNDEAPCLTGWGHANFKDSQYGSAFVTDFYKHIFELVLRLRGNYLWPAMWSSMFYLDDARNGPTASDWGVFMGTSHHEPMARADKEQSRFLKGAWDWKSNKAGVQAFMREGAERSRNWSTVYTLGMRGSGDAASATLTSQSLEEVIHWQQATLTQTLGRDLSQIPQQWVMYKEVPGYWQNGMNVSDDVTLLWSDDNRGNIRRVPVANETARRGGSGMYYHFDYVGDPRNYKWINTVQLQKTWEQMGLAWHRGIRNIWIVNVGDLKGLELPTAHLMAMAWDMDRFAAPTSTRDWLTDWCARQFGNAAAAANASAVMTAYGRLTARRKYEDLSMTPFAFSTVAYDEAERNYAEWEALAAEAQAVYDGLVASDAQPAFFELVLHPVLAGKTVFEIYTKAALGAKYAGEHRASANALAGEVQAAFAADKELKRRYHALLGGKWNHFMDQTHLGYNNWQEPSQDSIPKLSYVTGTGGGGASSKGGAGGIMGVSAQGSTTAYPAAATLALGAVNPYTPAAAQRWLEVFARGNGTCGYSVASNVTYVSVTNAQGTIASPPSGPASSDVRSLVSVDWAAAPAGHSVAALSVTCGDASATATVLLPLDKTSVPAGFAGHVEASGVVSIEAAHFDPAGSSSSSAYVVLPDYGRTLAGVKLPPLTPSQKADGSGPALAYPFYTFSDAAAPALTVYLSPSENANPVGPNRYAFAIVDDDGGENGTSTGTPTVVQPVPLANAGGEPQGWSDAVVAGAYVKTSKLGARLAPGRHVLRVWLLEPTMVLTKLVVDVGGLKSSALGPPESVIVGR